MKSLRVLYWARINILGPGLAKCLYLCTQMAIRFSVEMKIVSKNYSIAILIY